jgi:hypothetical protein
VKLILSLSQKRFSDLAEVKDNKRTGSVFCDVGLSKHTGTEPRREKSNKTGGEFHHEPMSSFKALELLW